MLSRSSSYVLAVFAITVQDVRISVVQAEPRPPASDVAALQSTESPTLATPVPVRAQKKNDVSVSVRRRVYPVVDVSGCGGRER